jgi:hypothetical protein
MLAPVSLALAAANARMGRRQRRALLFATRVSVRGIGAAKAKTQIAAAAMHHVADAAR